MVKYIDRTAGDDLGFELSLAVVMFHEAIAQRLGVNNTEHKVLDLIARHETGPTPGELAAATGLSNPAITKIVDRLVRAGLARRERNPDDGRSVRIALGEGYRILTRPATAALADRIWRLNETFTADELAAVGRWLTGVIDSLRAETRALRDAPPDP